MMFQSSLRKNSISTLLCIILFICCNLAVAEDGGVATHLSKWRSLNGLPELFQDRVLTKTAEEFAKELSSRGVLTHQSLSGLSLIERYREQGGTGKVIGEIIGSGVEINLIWEKWLVSNSHLDVLSNFDWTVYGVGITEYKDFSSSPVLIVVLLFAETFYQDVKIINDNNLILLKGKLLSSVTKQKLYPIARQRYSKVNLRFWDATSLDYVFELKKSNYPEIILLGVHIKNGVQEEKFTDRLIFYPP